MAADYSKLLANMHPSVRDVAKLFLEEATAAGLDPRLQETFRSQDRQAQLYAQGRTAPGSVVTKAKPGQSNHNYGVAFDVVPGSVIGKPNWAPEDPAWGRLGEIGKKVGLEWGGDWKFVDRPHFQLSGANWRKMQNDPAYANFAGGGGGAIASAPQPSGSPVPALSPGVNVADRQVAAVAPNGAAPQQAFGDMIAPQAPVSFANIIDGYAQRRRAAEEEHQSRQARLAALFADMPA